MSKNRSLKEQFFKFFDEHERVLEGKGQHIDWEYFKGNVPNGLKEFNAKLFHDYRGDWFQEEHNEGFNEYIRRNGLKSFSREEQDRYSSLGPQLVDLEKFIQILIKNDKNWVRQYDMVEISNTDFGGTRTPNELRAIYNNRRLHKWYGVIYILYQVIDINGVPIESRIENGKFITNGHFVIGFFTESWNSRSSTIKKTR